MIIPRQLAPTVGLSHDGFRFLEGAFLGFEEIADWLDEEEPPRKYLVV